MAGMNLEEKEDMSRFVIEVNQQYGTTIALIEHDMGVVMDLADRVVVLDYGKKIADGLPSEVQADQKRHRCLFRSRTLMELLYNIFIDPFVQMVSLPDFLLQVLWEGFVAGTLYALIALGFVLIFKASGVFNFAQGIMVVFAALSLVGLYQAGVPAYLALILALGIMALLAVLVERVVLRHMVNQPDIILFMSTIGLTYFLIGFGELVFGGEPKSMITEELGLPTGSTTIDVFDGIVILQHIDIAAAVIAAILVTGLAVFFNKTRIGRALRAVADDHQAALSVGISLNQIWAIVWFAAGIVALATGIMWGARSDVSVCPANHCTEGTAGTYPWRFYVCAGRNHWRSDYWLR